MTEKFFLLCSDSFMTLEKEFRGPFKIFKDPKEISNIERLTRRALVL